MRHIMDEIPEDHHDEYDNAQLPDWDMIDDWLHPDRAAIGFARGIVLGAPFWLALVGIVWLANSCIGGG